MFVLSLVAIHLLHSPSMTLNPDLKPPAVIAVLPSPNLSSDKWEDLKKQESVTARSRVESLFYERGFTVSADADVDKVVEARHLEIKDEEQWTRKNMIEVAKETHADFVVFVAIRQSRTKTVGNILLKRGAGEAQIELWLVDVASEKPILDGISKKGQKLAPPPGATGLRLGAVRSAVEAALQPTLKDLPVVQKDKS